jgi:hypothetical protein
MSTFWWKIRGERPLLLAHRPPFQDAERAVGRVVDVEGELYVVTRWVELPKVTLTRGGYTPEWQLWGRRATEAEVVAEVESAARLILEEDRPPD